MFRFSKKSSVEYLESSAPKGHDFFVHAFCTRRGGVSEGHFADLNFSVLEGDRDDKITQNWEIIASAFNLRVEQFFTVHQVHGDRILTVDHSNINILDHRSRQCDAIITDRCGLAIGIKTADCVPVFMADREKRIIGVVHAGWRGTALGIAAKAVTAFVGTFSSRPADMIAVIGPAIGPCCYEVDETVFKAETGDGNWETAFNPCKEKGKWMLDLPSANRRQLIRAGVPPESVFSADVCTCCRKDLFFSHRGEDGKTGRQINFMMLKENKSV
jgi:YfiH family protein